MTLLNSGIYKILNTVNNKFYIGSAVNLNSRFRTHKANLINNKHPNKHLQAAFNKYGANSEARKGKKLSKSHIQNAVNGRLGYTHTTETKNKIGKSNSKPEKWPHPKKYKCNCRECLDKKNLIRKQPKLYTLITCEID